MSKLTREQLVNHSKQIKCIESYNQGVCATKFGLQYDEYELIKEAFDYYTNSLNDGKGIPIVNRYVGTLLAKIGDHVEGGV